VEAAAALEGEEAAEALRCSVKIRAAAKQGKEAWLVVTVRRRFCGIS
jgi:hypothetical protein